MKVCLTKENGMKKVRDEVSSAEWIMNGLLNIKTAMTLDPKLKSNSILLMAMEQIKNGLGEEWDLD